MAIKKMPIGKFVAELRAALERKDGYIMGSKGQNPKKWATNSWWFTQYSGTQKTKALYWRENASRVWDCNGMAEGIYEYYTGVNINTKARYNYSGWCGTKGTGTIPTKYRVPGASVFIYSATSGYITHVGYLDKPVKESNPAGDWYVIEARGVMYGVVQTKLSQRGWNRWGLMTKYFDYSDTSAKPSGSVIGDEILQNGDESDAVKQLQLNLIRLGYECGKWGADGDFGDQTETAVEEFQKDHGLEVDGKYGPLTHAAMEKALAKLDSTIDDPKKVCISGGQCWIRSTPSTSGAKLGIARSNVEFEYAGQTAENGWLCIKYNGKNAWVSGKYGKLIAD